MLKKCYQDSVNENYLSRNAYSTRWKFTAAQITLNDKDDIDALCPINTTGITL